MQKHAADSAPSPGAAGIRCDLESPELSVSVSMASASTVVTALNQDREVIDTRNRVVGAQKNPGKMPGFRRSLSDQQDWPGSGQ